MLAACREIDPAIAVLILTAYGTVEAAARAFRLGAKDFLAKPVRRDDLLAALHRALEASRVARASRAARQRLRGHASFRALVGTSPKLARELDLAARAAVTDIAVLIRGETGTGKDLVAAAIHAASPRAEQPLVTAVLAAGPGELQKSALFGHVKGSFTGATSSQRGYFQEADKGTLFLDEVGDVSPDTQVALLRAVEKKVIRPLGAGHDVAADVRILSATNRDLERDVRAGRFREDLYYRLGGLFITMPPLRERPEDIPLLAAHFAGEFVGGGRPLPEFEPEAVQALAAYRWPGNVRELKNVVERAVLLSGGETIRAEHCLVLPARPAAGGEWDALYELPLRAAGDGFTALYLKRLLARFGGDTQKVADHAQVHVTSIRRKMRELGLARDGPTPEDG
jgi:DNA-binding NtrC family response regulator